MHQVDRIRTGSTTRDMGCCRCRRTRQEPGNGETQPQKRMPQHGDWGELHRVLNSRKGSLSATYKKNVEANDKAYDLNQKTLQALDALVADYIAFDATMANVTSQHEAGYAIHTAAAETAGELERIRADCRTTWTVHAMIWLRPPGSSPTAGQHTRPRA